MRWINNKLAKIANICRGLRELGYDAKYLSRIDSLEHESRRQRKHLIFLHYQIKELQQRKDADIRREIIAMKPSLN